MLRDNGLLLIPEWLDEIKNNNIIDDNNIGKFESMISDYVGVKYCVATCNGTTAILMSLMAMGLTEGDEIIIPSYSYPSVKVCCQQLKLNIKYCDININTLCMDTNKLEELITSNTKAVAFIDHLGYIGNDLFKVREICDRYNLLLLEDSAQGLSQIYNNKMAGTIGNIGIYSFSGAKLLRSGEGGCLVTNSRYYYDKIKSYINMGIGNYVLSPLSATLLSLQLRDINIILENRNRIQQLYRNNLNIVYHENNNDSVHAVAYITDKADLIYNTFKLKNIETRYKMYPSQNNMSNSDYIFERYIELPQSYDLTKEDIDNICSDIIKLESKKSTDKLSSLMSRFNK